MKNLLAFLAALALAVVFTGWYLGWFEVSQRPLPNGRHAVEIDIDKEKVADDLHKGTEEVLKEGREQIKKLMEKKQDTKARAPGTEEPAEPHTPR